MAQVTVQDVVYRLGGSLPALVAASVYVRLMGDFIGKDPVTGEDIYEIEDSELNRFCRMVKGQTTRGN